MVNSINNWYEYQKNAIISTRTAHFKVMELKLD